MHKQALFALALGALLVPALSAAPAEAATIIIHRTQPAPQPQVVVVRREAPPPRPVIVRYEQPRHHGHAYGHYESARYVPAHYEPAHYERGHR
jgi:hypothetical protein